MCVRTACVRARSHNVPKASKLGDVAQDARAERVDRRTEDQERRVEAQRLVGVPREPAPPRARAQPGSGNNRKPLRQACAAKAGGPPAPLCSCPHWNSKSHRDGLRAPGGLHLLVAGRAVGVGGRVGRARRACSQSNGGQEWCLSACTLPLGSAEARVRRPARPAAQTGGEHDVRLQQDGRVIMGRCLRQQQRERAVSAGKEVRHVVVFPFARRKLKVTHQGGDLSQQVHPACAARAAARGGWRGQVRAARKRARAHGPSGVRRAASKPRTHR